jgi:CheY-like chemotaxis protein
METILAVVTDLFFAVKVTDGAKRAGREVKYVQNLQQALAYSQQAKPVMVVADLNCRDVDCLEFARQLKNDPGTSAIPMLGFLSHVQEDLKQAALAAGFDRVVARSTFSDKARDLLAG